MIFSLFHELFNRKKAFYSALLIDLIPCFLFWWVFHPLGNKELLLINNVKFDWLVNFWLSSLSM